MCFMVTMQVIAGGLAYVLKHLQRVAQYGSDKRKTSSSLTSNADLAECDEQAEEYVLYCLACLSRE